MDASPCPICAAPAGHEFLEAGETPALLNVLCPDPDAARRLPRGSIRLGLCGCGLVRNLAYDPARVHYDGAYENSLHFSETFRRHAAALAAGLARRHRLAGGRAVEVGCGDGGFLVELAAAAGCECVGFDPAHDPGRAALPAGIPVRIHSRPFSIEAAGRADLLCCRHVLEHLEDPVAFLEALGPCLGPDGALYCEVPDSLPALRGEAVWDLIYEHPLYFTAPALLRLLERAGFTAIRMESLYAGQFLAAEAAPGRRGQALPCPAAPAPEELPRLAALLAGRRERVIQAWNVRLERRAGRRLVLWGAGSKGVCFLNTMDRYARRIAAAVDLNPRKHGRFIAGTGHPILAPEALREAPPDGVIVLNQLYAEEIRAALAALGLAPELLAQAGAGARA